MKVAVWGSCKFGNYGDDIMVLMYSRFVKDQGATPVAYGLNEGLAKKYGIETVFTLDELIRDASFTLIAGGSWLEKHKFDEKKFEFERDMTELLSTLEKYNCPLYSFSIGGDGHIDAAVLTPARRAIFTSDSYKGGTVRLEKDVQLMQSINKQVKLFPDVVLSLPEFWKPSPQNTAPSRRKRIGMQVLGPAGRLISNTINSVSWLYPAEYNFIHTHLPEYGITYEQQFEKEDAKRKNFQYEDPQSFIDFISGLDVVVASKLHPCVTAVAYGVPFLLLGGLNKTKNFLESVNSEKTIVPDAGYLRKYILKNSLVKEAAGRPDWTEIRKQQKESIGHFQTLKEVIASYA
ncbi:MAG: polysaccharide pyruvyl transferase family protein [Candidatus Pseudobacter hemicellulosilyticus]|uniref:Polysaccharide pyruvyl transferase family protein n=1 Tax=Candidatus Pseudobacter hemicellulosilyticus TaxID=3121375 RepID=A0AAJ5WYC3_9BACT|nr:MAG: polysaccharide pyruvyl transferase family protein [Pseudobacter sp.]